MNKNQKDKKKKKGFSNNIKKLKQISKIRNYL